MGALVFSRPFSKADPLWNETPAVEGEGLLEVRVQVNTDRVLTNT